MNVAEHYARVELYINGEEAEQRLNQLERLREEIERDLSFELNWGDQSETARDRRISCYLRDVDLQNKETWQEQHSWLSNRLNKMYRVFSKRVSESQMAIQ